MRVLITGGAGFIGSHLSSTLIKKGYRVICIDNLITGSLSNISHIKSSRFSFIKKDVCKKVYIKERINYILHLASPASPVDYIRLPLETMAVGSIGTGNMLELAREKKAVFLFASTSEVYGDPLTHPQKESYFGNVNPIGIRSVYDEAKRFGEALTMAYLRKYKLNVKICRIFNTYGERMRRDDGRVVPNFITQAIQNRPLTVYGKGSQTRSFCYVSDLVNGIIRLMKSSLNGPVNLGNPGEINILNFAKLIIRLTKSKSKIVFKKMPLDDPKMRKPDITKAKKFLHWCPKVSIEDGIQKTIKWFK